MFFFDNLYPEANGVGTRTIYLLQLGVGTRSFSLLETRCASVKALPLTVLSGGCRCLTGEEVSLCLTDGHTPS